MGQNHTSFKKSLDSLLFIQCKPLPTLSEQNTKLIKEETQRHTREELECIAQAIQDACAEKQKFLLLKPKTATLQMRSMRPMYFELVVLVANDYPAEVRHIQALPPEYREIGEYDVLLTLS